MNPETEGKSMWKEGYGFDTSDLRTPNASRNNLKNITVNAISLWLRPFLVGCNHRSSFFL